MVSLYIEGFGDAKHVARAIDNAKLTSLAPVSDNDDFAFARLDGLLIQRSPPILHRVPLRNM
jgi:hypothetical protein